MYPIGNKPPKVFKNEIASFNPDLVFCPFPYLCVFISDWEIMVQRLGSFRMFEGGPTVGWMCDQPNWAFHILANEYGRKLKNYRHRILFCSHQKHMDMRGNDVVMAMTLANFRMLDDLSNVIVRLDSFRSLTWEQPQPSCM